MHRARSISTRPTTGTLPAPRGGLPLRLLAVGGAALLLTGCGTPSPGREGAASPGATPSATASTAPTTGATPAVDAPGGSGSGDVVAGGATAGPTTRPRPIRTCAPEAIDVVLGGTDSGAGSIDYTVVLTNRGPRPCTVSGAPTARMLSAAEDQLGAEATGSGTSGPVVRLAPGAAAVTVVRVVNVAEDGGPLGGRCTPQPAVALAIDSDVYNRYDRLDGDFRGCEEGGVAYMSVTPFRAM